MTAKMKAIILHRWEMGRVGIHNEDVESIVEVGYPVIQIKKYEATTDYKNRLWDSASDMRSDAQFRTKVYLGKDDYDWVTETVQEITNLINGA